MFPAESLMGELVGVPWVSCSALHSFSITLDWGEGRTLSSWNFSYGISELRHIVVISSTLHL